MGADNDAFNFWLPAWGRPDQEYTSGVRGALEFDGASKWLAPFRRLGAYVTCDREGPCGTHSFGIGQAIYTGFVPDYSLVDFAPGFVPPASRPNAGWLFLQLSERDSSSRGAGELSLSVGVVGPPALGEQMQQLFHAIAPSLQRPTDWTRQLPAEPGFVVRYNRMTQIVSFRDGALWRGSIVSHLGGAIGTVATDAVAGAGIRADVSFRPGSADASSPRLALAYDTKQRLVLRDEFLDGTLFRSSEKMKKHPFVAERSVAVSFFWGPLALTYRATWLGMQYEGQGEASSWGTIESEWRLRR